MCVRSPHTSWSSGRHLLEAVKFHTHVLVEHVVADELVDAEVDHEKPGGHDDEEWDVDAGRLHHVRREPLARTGVIGDATTTTWLAVERLLIGRFLW